MQRAERERPVDARLEAPDTPRVALDLPQTPSLVMATTYFDIGRSMLSRAVIARTVSSSDIPKTGAGSTGMWKTTKGRRTAGSPSQLLRVSMTSTGVRGWAVSLDSMSTTAAPNVFTALCV